MTGPHPEFENIIGPSSATAHIAECNRYLLDRLLHCMAHKYKYFPAFRKTSVEIILGDPDREAFQHLQTGFKQVGEVQD